MQPKAKICKDKNTGKIRQPNSNILCDHTHSTASSNINPNSWSTELKIRKLVTPAMEKVRTNYGLSKTCHFWVGSLHEMAKTAQLTPLICTAFGPHADLHVSGACI